VLCNSLVPEPFLNNNELAVVDSFVEFGTCHINRRSYTPRLLVINRLLLPATLSHQRANAIQRCLMSKDGNYVLLGLCIRIQQTTLEQYFMISLNSGRP